MDFRDLLTSLGFSPKDGFDGVFSKTYRQADNYCIEIDLDKQIINYGNLVKFDSKTTQNLFQSENFVVLECVNRLLEKGYKPGNIVLEKTWSAGHGASGRLDICVTRDDGSEYLLIECKTYGKEFDKAFARMKKDGGQLFTYYIFSRKADVIMLYASELKGNEVVYRNEIVKIEDDYRTGDVKDFYEKWNKLTKDNGIFEGWVKPYNFESKALTINDLVEIKQEDSSFIFNRFLEILRHNVVSDKGNAFNRIFTLFLCKIYDEKVNEGTNNELGFQWFNTPFKYEDNYFEKDNHRSFQIRLTDLYKNGMHEFLEKVVTDISETEFKNKFPNLTEQERKPIWEVFRKIRLEKNNEFAIKDVYDEQSFDENVIVIKEIVQLLEKYKLRYAKKQQYLSDFFELLLTTGLKQESGQFFTPVPIAQFIIKSLPIDTIVEEKLFAAKIDNDTLLPYIMDYASGSGHFLTETMHEIQRLIDKKDEKKYHASIVKTIKNWKEDHFKWAIKYIYGVEKDYRLVKVGKVGCYLHGDGLANVIHSDGLARFTHADYKGKLSVKDSDCIQDNKQFDIVVSNPPYAVSAFRNNAGKYYGKDDFELYKALTDNSSEIECLFVERTKQLLKDGGVAGIILPSSMLSNEGIYTKTREIILKYFEIVAITEMGSNTFMATGTNTVVLFLRRRNNYDCQNFAARLENALNTYQDNTINGIEKPITKYINHVWENIGFEDYVSLLKKEPVNAVINHDIYKEYQKKIKAKTEKIFWDTLLETEKEKLLYFILAYPQKVVLVKTGEKDAEKRFLGYEFSNRRGSEGIHPMQRGKTIDECTRLFDDNLFDNPEKASTYIYKAFSNDYEFPIHESLKNNISRLRLVDMLTFDRAGFAKNISTAIKKKVGIKSKWTLIRLGDVLFENNKSNIKVGTAKDLKEGEYPFFTSGNSVFKYDEYLVDNQNIYLSTGGSAIVKFYNGKAAYSTDTFVIRSNDEEKIKTKFIFHFLENIILIVNDLYFKGVGLKHLQKSDFRNIQIPLPPKDIQQKIVAEIEVLEKKEADVKEKIEKGKEQIENILEELDFDSVELENIVSFKNGLNYSRKSLGDTINIIGVSDFQNNITPNLDLIEQIQIEGSLTEEYLLQPNDLLVVRSNGSAILVGRFLLIDKVLPNTSFSGFTIRLRPDFNKVDSKYLCYYLRTKKVREKLTKNSSGSNIKSLNQILLSSLTIPLPPLSEQQKVVSEIEKIEMQIDEAQKIIESIPVMKNDVLKKY